MQAPPDIDYTGGNSSEIPFGLVTPYNGTRPTLTTTLECVGDLSLPVIAGADVVAYFSMEEGQKPEIATGDIRTTYDGNLFYFNTHENKQTFEVCMLGLRIWAYSGKLRGAALQYTTINTTTTALLLYCTPVYSAIW